jgi:hypothetical protein
MLICAPPLNNFNQLAKICYSIVKQCKESRRISCLQNFFFLLIFAMGWIVSPLLDTAGILLYLVILEIFFCCWFFKQSCPSARRARLRK